jgi:hypothetical protein
VRTAVSRFERASTRVRRLASRLWLAARVGAWLCILPLTWRARDLTTAVEQIGPARPPERTPSLEIDAIVSVVRRMAVLRLFTLSIFPGACLREALALYHVLSHAGQPVEFCVGVMKAEERFVAHSWVSLLGNPIVAADRGRGFRVLYSYPDTQFDRAPHTAGNNPRFA